MSSKISFDQYISASGKYPERLKSDEITEEVTKNVTELLNRVNALLADLNLNNISVSSGFRPSAVNAATPGAAKKSNHTIGKACDLYDPKGELDKLFMANLSLLEKYGLWLEDPKSTPSWSHLQSVAPRSGNRVFKP